MPSDACCGSLHRVAPLVYPAPHTDPPAECGHIYVCCCLQVDLDKSGFLDFKVRDVL